MHTDRKIGFAMGILLIGIVAALFFRNEPLLSTKVPCVRRERELNQTLRERDVAVYLDDSALDETSEQTQNDPPWSLRDVLQNMDERNKTAPVPVGSKAFAQPPDARISDAELDGYRPKKRRAAEQSVVAEIPLRTLKTDPDRSNAGRSESRPLPPLMPEGFVNGNTVGSPALDVNLLGGSKDQPRAAEPAFDFRPPKEFEEYMVKYGDTLSGIAQRTLGSPNKYNEIYNANRDRMASPDRLTVGKPLRIPRMTEVDRTADERSRNNGNLSL